MILIMKIIFNLWCHVMQHNISYRKFDIIELASYCDEFPCCPWGAASVRPGLLRPRRSDYHRGELFR